MSLADAYSQKLGLNNASSPSTTGGVESMFQQILQAVNKSQLEIADLRQECADLRQANTTLERQVREGLILNQGGYTSRPGTPGGYSAPSTPQMRAVKTPFLNPSSIPSASPIPTALANTSSPLQRDGSSYLVPPEGTGDIPGFYVVIPAGGAGTRLWPLSREGHPKFLLDLTLKGRSLIQATWDRLLPLSTDQRTTIVCGSAHAGAIKEQLPDILDSNVFMEPGPKESMAAIGLAAAVLARRDPNAIIGSFAADHMIAGDEAFLSAVREAVQVAKKDYLVTIGIAPAHPSTGFGYVRLGEPLCIPEASNARLVNSFKEKPDARTAAAYIATGNYRWNAGMFVTKATFLLDLLKHYKPDLHMGLQTIASHWDNETEREKTLKEVWPSLEKIAIDNAIAEPAALEGKVAVIPGTFGWDDVGDFSSLSDLLPHDLHQPCILGDPRLVLTEQMAGGMVVPGTGRLIACLGVDDLVIVDMPDTLLVTTRARSQEVKRLVKKAKDAGWRQLL